MILSMSSRYQDRQSSSPPWLQCGAGGCNRTALSLNAQSRPSSHSQSPSPLAASTSPAMFPAFGELRIATESPSFVTAWPPPQRATPLNEALALLNTRHSTDRIFINFYKEKECFQSTPNHLLPDTLSRVASTSAALPRCMQNLIQDCVIPGLFCVHTVVGMNVLAAIGGAPVLYMNDRRADPGCCDDLCASARVRLFLEVRNQLV